MHKVLLNKENNYDKITIANEFSKYFANVGATLAANIRPMTKFFGYPINKTNSQINENSLSINGIQKFFFSLKMNENAVFREINVNILQSVFRVNSLKVH